MTDNEIKEMLKDIINNGAEYECTIKDFAGDYSWIKYKLGDEIHSNWKYRKVELWLVLDSELEANKYVCIPRSEYETKRTCPKPYFTGTKEECEAFIKEHTKKTWLEEYIEDNATSEDRAMAYMTSKEICKKILEEVKDCDVITVIGEPDSNMISRRTLKEIIRELGVEV